MSTLRLAARKAHVLRSQARLASTQTASTSSIRTGVYATAFALSAGLFTVYYLDSRSALHRYVITPLLRYSLDAETGHKLAVKVLSSGLAPRDPLGDAKTLETRLWDYQVSNPVGLAAGFDKDGEAIDGLFNLGFSWVEIGSITPKPQLGNPKPRVFHLPEDSALINRYGFPSQGHTAVLARLRSRLPAFFQPTDHESVSLRNGSLLAVNLGKNKSSPVESIDDFVAGVRTLGPYADVLVVNVSSPNTPGLRGLQNREHLESLLSGVAKARDELASTNIVSHKPKLVLKLAPDLDETQLTEIASIVREANIDGIILSNTTVQRPSHLLNTNKVQTGGLSGTPLKPLTLAALRTLRGALPASIPIIGCGGIVTGSDALEFAKAGASFIQIYTSFGYDGVGTCRRIKTELEEELKKDGKSWQEVVDAAVTELSWKKPSPSLNLDGEIKKDEVTVERLTVEAEHLKELVDQLAAHQL